jgi:uncharacterized membrane protein YhhN
MATKPATTEGGRVVLNLALLAGVTYLVPATLGWTGGGVIVWKGLGVGLLALHAVTRARSRDGWLLAGVLAAGALGDVLLDAVSLLAGATAFAIGHVVAIVLYLGNQRSASTASQTAAAIALASLTPAIAWALTSRPDVALYSVLLGIMAALAWRSRFSRYRTGIGAAAFVASDLLIFATMGMIASGPMTGFLIWALYFGGQALIATGVITTLSAE